MKYRNCLLIYFAILLLASCQTTPEDTAVVQKYDMLQLAKDASQEYETYRHIDSWSETVETANDNLIINIECNVEVPDTNAFPVLKVIPVAFDTERIQTLLNYLAPECKFYSDPYELTKEQIENQIVSLKRGELIDGEYVVSDAANQLILELNEQLAQADYFKDRTYIAFDDIGLGDNASVSIGAESENGDYVIKISNIDAGGSFGFSKGNHIQTDEHLQVEDVAITEQEAIEQANRAINDLGIEGFTIAKVQKAQLFSIDGSYIVAKGYQIRYMRLNGELETVDIGDGTTVNRNALPDYCAPWDTERIDIMVDENGIERFYWDGLSKIDETISNNVRILPCEEIQDRIRKQLEYKFVWIENNDTRLTVNENRIALGAALTNVKDEPDVGLLVPCWYILYDQVFDIEGSEETSTEKDALVLNAIDGSVIEPRVTTSVLSDISE